jgi:hypothetical protein
MSETSKLISSHLDALLEHNDVLANEIGTLASWRAIGVGKLIPL